MLVICTDKCTIFFEFNSKFLSVSVNCSRIMYVLMVFSYHSLLHYVTKFKAACTDCSWMNYWIISQKLKLDSWERLISSGWSPAAFAHSVSLWNNFWCRDSNSLIKNHITYYCEIFYALENSYCFTRLIFAKLKKIVFVNQIFVKFYFHKNIEKLHNSWKLISQIINLIRVYNLESVNKYYYYTIYYHETTILFITTIM